jgi:hypothetical protein
VLEDRAQQSVLDHRRQNRGRERSCPGPVCGLRRVRCASRLARVLDVERSAGASTAWRVRSTRSVRARRGPTRHRPRRGVTRWCAPGAGRRLGRRWMVDHAGRPRGLGGLRDRGDRYARDRERQCRSEDAEHRAPPPSRGSRTARSALGFAGAPRTRRAMDRQRRRTQVRDSVGALAGSPIRGQLDLRSQSPRSSPTCSMTRPAHRAGRREAIHAGPARRLDVHRREPEP